MDDKDVELLAGILSGLLVPLSLGSLGAAREPLIGLMDRLSLSGWFSREEAEQAIRKTGWVPEPLPY